MKNKINWENYNVVFFSFGKYPYPNLGVGYLVSNLRKKGFNCNFKYLESPNGDVNTSCGMILKENPDIIGITATSVHFNKIKKLCKILKNRLKNSAYIF